ALVPATLPESLGRRRRRGRWSAGARGGRARPDPRWWCRSAGSASGRASDRANRPGRGVGRPHGRSSSRPCCCSPQTGARRRERTELGGRRRPSADDAERHGLLVHGTFLKRTVFGDTVALSRSKCIGTKVFGMYWHLSADNDWAYARSWLRLEVSGPSG